MHFFKSNPAQYARDILFNLNIEQFPIDPFIIGDIFGIRFSFHSFSTVEAVLLIKSGRKHIILKDYQYFEPKIRFTVAHELGHYFLPWHKGNYFKCKDSDIGKFKKDNTLEREADIFAAELLMPEKMIEKDVDSSTFSLELLKTLSREYWVSITSMALRAIEFTYDPVCIVMTCDGKIQWHKKSQTFNKNVYSFGYKLNQYSNAYDFFNCGKIIDDSPEQVYSMAWLADGDDEEPVIEETLIMPSYNSALTVLTLMNDEYCYLD